MYFNNLLFVFPKSRLAFHLHLEKKNPHWTVDSIWLIWQAFCFSWIIPHTKVFKSGFCCPQNGPLPLKYRVRPNCKKMKVSHAEHEGLNSTSRSGVESDSASDKAGSPAGAPSASSSLPSPVTPAQSPQPPAPSSVNGTPAAAPTTPGRSFTQFGNGSGSKPRKVSLNGSSGWRGAPDWSAPERPTPDSRSAVSYLLHASVVPCVDLLSFFPFIVLNILPCKFSGIRDISW